jgi:hypothetical protein
VERGADHRDVDRMRRARRERRRIERGSHQERDGDVRVELAQLEVRCVEDGAAARAFRNQRLPDEGRYGSISEMAVAERICPGA